MSKSIKEIYDELITIMKEDDTFAQLFFVKQTLEVQFALKEMLRQELGETS